MSSSLSFSSLLKRRKNLQSRLRAPNDVDASQGASSQHSKTWKDGTTQPSMASTPSLHHASLRHLQPPRQITASLVYHMSCKPRYSDMLLRSCLCTAQDMRIANSQPTITTGSTTTGRCLILGRLSSTPNFYSACATHLRPALAAIPLCGLNSCLWWRQWYSSTLLAGENVMQTCRLRLVGLQVLKELE